MVEKILKAPLKELKLNFGGYSTQGIKDENQDAFTARLPKDHATRKFKGAIACIADGVSGSKNSQLASQTAVTNFASDYFSTPEYWTVQQSAQRVISAINAWLFQQGRLNHIREDGYVTTFSALIVKSHTAHVLHAGDSRVYRIKNDEVELITRDHSYRQGNQSVLSRALGVDQQLDLDYHSFKVNAGDRFLLTTDGVHDYLSLAQITSLLKTNQSLEQTSKVIVNQALAEGSQDNLSCLLVELAQLPIERLAEAFTDAKQLVIPPALIEGNKLDGHEIKKVIHSSTRSHVYLARSDSSQTPVVLKVPSTAFQDDVHYLECFAREQWVGRKLNHPQIVKLHHPPADSQFLYHVSNYIQGQTLSQWIKDNPRPLLTTVREILSQMIHPVRALHRSKMVHRDLKPENFMIDDDGCITLIDLGSVKVAGLEEISFEDQNSLPEGDLQYIAPEVLLDNVSNRLSDQFSLAAIVYELLTGHTPYNCVKSSLQFPKRYEGWKYRPINTFVQRGDIPSWVDNVLRTALNPRPSKRFEALSEFEQALSNPSAEILNSMKHKPLFEKDPLLAWKSLSGVLLSLVLFLLYLILSQHG